MAVIRSSLTYFVIFGLTLNLCTPAFGMQSVKNLGNRMAMQAKMAATQLRAKLPKLPFKLVQRPTQIPTYKSEHNIPKKIGPVRRSLGVGGWQTLKAKLRSWLPSWAKSTPKPQTIAALTTLGAIAIATSQTAHAAPAKNQPPVPFNWQNVDEYPEYKEQFIAYIAWCLQQENFGTTLCTKEFYQAFCRLLQNNETTQGSLADRFFPMLMENFAHLNGAYNLFDTVLKKIDKNNPAHHQNAVAAFTKHITTDLYQLRESIRTCMKQMPSIIPGLIPAIIQNASKVDNYIKFDLWWLFLRTDEALQNIFVTHVQNYLDQGNTIDQVISLYLDAHLLDKLRPAITKHLSTMSTASLIMLYNAWNNQVKNDIIDIITSSHKHVEEIFDSNTDNYWQGHRLRERIISHLKQNKHHFTSLSLIAVARLTYHFQNDELITPTLLPVLKQSFKQHSDLMSLSIIIDIAKSDDTLIPEFAKIVINRSTGWEYYRQLPINMAHKTMNPPDAFWSATKKAVMHILLETDLDTLFKTIDVHRLDHIYQYLPKADQETVKQRFQAHVKNKNIIDTLLSEKSLPSFAVQCTKDNHSGTQTEKHACFNLKEVMQKLNAYRSTQQMLPAMGSMLMQAFKKEQEEQAKGNYTFYHAQRWQWHFKSDMYKQFWNLAHPTQHVGSDYQFLRFGKNRERNQYYVKDALFMNAPLFGNTTQEGSCTYCYLMSNHDYSHNRNNQFSTQWLSQQFDLESAFKNHKKEFEELETLHSKASKYGNLLLISTNEKDIQQHTHTADWAARKLKVRFKDKTASDNSKQVIDALKTKPESFIDSDVIEYVMEMNDTTLNPQTGPRIYSFNAADPALLKEYETKRDALFAKIKQELDQSKAAQA